jgi:tetratricopeptide (TPR) repeat protein
MKIKNILFVVYGLLIISSCTEKDLTVLPDGRELDATFYQTDEQIIEALNGAYDPLQHIIWGGSTFMWGSITSDDAVGGGENIDDQRGYQVADLYMVTAVEDDEQDLEDFYKLWWRMNTRCNAIIKYANAESQLGSKGIANAYFLKGLAYFQLTRMFGGMPIIDDIPGIDSKYPRSTQEETWAAIERYLTTAIDATVDGKGLGIRTGMKDPTDGYATLGTAQMLLGKVYLYQGKYTQAIDILEQMAASGQYRLETDYSQVFWPGNKHGVESVFEINMTSLGTQSWDGPVNNGNALATLVSPRAFTNNTLPFADGVHISGWGMNQPTEKLVQAFDNMGDTSRKYVSVISTDTLQYVCDTAGVATSWQNSITGWWDNKHSLRQGFFLSQTQVNQNIIVLRYADALLMLAEAYNRNGDDENAQYYLNQVRERANLSSVTVNGEALLTAIKKERQLELCLEGDRYFDLVRWGDATTELTGEEYDAGGLNYSNGRPGVITNGLFPIPADEIANYGDFDFPQNAGY